jgi:hypothetical protein
MLQGKIITARSIFLSALTFRCQFHGIFCLFLAGRSNLRNSGYGSKKAAQKNISNRAAFLKADCLVYKEAMKHCLSILFLMVISPSLVEAQVDSLAAQSNGAQNVIRREWGMNTYAFNLRPGDFYSGYKIVQDHYLFNGIYYKRYWGNNSMRYGVGFYQKIINDGTFFHTNSSRFIRSRFLQLSVGYQRMFSSRKVSPYFFSDVALQSVKELISGRSNTGTWDYILPYYGNSIMRKELGAGVSAGLGIRVRIKKSLVLNIESGTLFYYAYGYISDVGRNYKELGANVSVLNVNLGILLNR